MEEDEKKLRKDAVDDPFADWDNIEIDDFEPDATALAGIRVFDEMDTFAGIDRFWAGERARAESMLDLPSAALLMPATYEAPGDTATPAIVAESTLALPGISVRRLFRGTKRKAGKARPNCFGSQYLHDPGSEDCRSCKFSEGCKKTIIDEIPVLRAAGTAHKAHLQPAADLTQLESWRIFIRGRHLREYRNSRKKRLRNDRAYQRDMRANTGAEKQIEIEAHKRLVALRSITAHPRGNKRVEQLAGKEEFIISVWIARQRAILAYGRNASDTQTAQWFEELGGGPFTRHQARSYRLLFRRLGNPLRKPTPKPQA